MSRKSFALNLLAIVPLLLAINSHSQGVMVNLSQPSTNQWNVADLWNLTLTNTSSKAIKVYLHGTVDAQSDGLIFEGTSAVFGLAANFSGRIDPRLLEPAKVGYANSDYEEIVMRTGTMKEGIYTICITVQDASTGAELGRGCIVQPIVEISPPELLNPEDGAKLTDPLPALMWLPPTPLTGNSSVSYSLRIVELYDEQIPIEAMEANPAWYTEKGINSTSFQIPVSARPMMPEKLYAWQVTAFAGKKRYEIGKSQVWSFVYDSKNTLNYLPTCDTLCQMESLWVFGTPALSSQTGPWDLGDNNTLYLTQPLTINNFPIILLKAEIVYFRWFVEKDCKKCNSDFRQWGNLTSGTVTDSDFTTNGQHRSDEYGVVLNNSHELWWKTPSDNPASFSGNVKLNISLPPQTELNCCKDCFKFCVRYTFTMMIEDECVSCSSIQCYKAYRQHKKLLTQYPPVDDCGYPGQPQKVDPPVKL